jgi:hypothetical protein
MIFAYVTIWFYPITCFKGSDRNEKKEALIKAKLNCQVSWLLFWKRSG